MMRIHMLRRLRQAGIRKVCGIAKLVENAPATILGLIYKEMTLKPSAFDEDPLTGESLKKSLCSDEDTVYLEDESGRVKLNLDTAKPLPDGDGFGYAALSLRKGGSKLSVGDFVTGQVVAIAGKLNSKDRFEVSRVVLPGYSKTKQNAEVYQALKKGLKNRQNELIHPLSHYLKTDTSSKFVAIVSGLNINSETGQVDLHNLKDFLFGEFSRSGLSGLASRIARLVVAGDSTMRLDDLQKELDEQFNVEGIQDQIFEEKRKSIKEFDCGSAPENADGRDARGE